MKKKILFLSPLPPPHYGASLLCEKCLNILQDSKNFEIHNIKLNYSRKMNDVGKINFKKIFGIFSVKKQINQELKNFKPGLIYFAPATSGLGLIRDNFFVQLIKKKNFSIIFHVHSRANSSKSFEKKLLKKMFFGERAIVLGEELVKDVSWIIPKKNIRILSNAIKNEVSVGEFRKILINRKKKKIPNILFLSNMDETKGWFKVLEACNLLKDKKIDFKCNFVGAWPSKIEEKRFFDYVSKNNLKEKVFYLGKKIGEDKNRIFASSDIFVFPTEYKLETFGLVILEAMMFGLPVIATDIATIPSTVIHKQTGFVLKENTPQAISNEIMELIKNKSLQHKMGALGRKRFIENYEINNYRKKLIKLMKGF